MYVDLISLTEAIDHYIEFDKFINIADIKMKMERLKLYLDHRADELMLEMLEDNKRLKLAS